jgi:hypothetical protein
VLLPSDEQRDIVSRIAIGPREGEEPVGRRKREMWWYGMSNSDREEQISTAIAQLVDIRNSRKENRQ